MYDGSQIQNNSGTNENNEGNSRSKIGSSLDGKITCQKCNNYFGHNLIKHIINFHHISTKEYQEQFGEITSPSYKEKMSKSCKNSLKVNSNEERKRRSILLGNLNKTDKFRKKASETAIKTSARKDIQEQRTKNLKNWRDENPDEFFEKCTKKMLSYKSLGEGLLVEILGDSFKRNQFLESKQYFDFNKTFRKQVDFIDWNTKISIEFDGEFHFKDAGLISYSEVLNKDLKFNSYILEEKKYSLIRISFDCIQYKTPYKNSILRPGIKELLLETIQTAKLGKIYYIGKSYGNNSIV